VKGHVYRERELREEKRAEETTTTDPRLVDAK